MAIYSTLTGRLTEDAKVHSTEKAKFMTFTVATNDSKGDSIFVECIRFYNEIPKNFDSFKKRAIVSLSGEPSVSIYQPEGETKPKASIQINVKMVEILQKAKDATTNDPTAA